MPVQKVIIESVVLIEADTPKAAQAIIEGMEPTAVMEMCDTGEAIGNFKVKTAHQVPKDQIKAETEALGSDESFFSGLESGDFLATARIFFKVAAADLEGATKSADDLVGNLVETSDIIGEGGVDAIDPLVGDSWTVAANVAFRTQGDDINDARQFASTRLKDVVAEIEFIESGEIVSVEDDLA